MMMMMMMILIMMRFMDITGLVTVSDRTGRAGQHSLARGGELQRDGGGPGHWAGPALSPHTQEEET